MNHSPAPIVYLRLRSRVRMIQGQDLHLGDVAHLLTEPEWEKDLLELVLKRPQKQDGNLILVDMLQIISKIRDHIPGVVVESLGKPHVLVELVERPRKPSKILFVLVWLLLFFGSALTIMNFHADVSMMEVQVRIVEMITGQKDEHPYLFQIAYSIGIGFGMIVFFNHLFKKKWNEEPTPLEVEMYLYQENVDQYVVAEEYEKMARLQTKDKKP
ncbi:stage V sporulation protein AA [Paenibacillus polymyxa]|jgi:stage V sporulation protein AA|uniref:Stage V sporulation protein AA n=1 Tax=Paenibacillus polymyxa TaxID=1406 RepID=A0A0F0G305_PAEPO|nr:MULTISPECIES: stage V sporulation protein AA [Paenibacillus]AHM66601.1 stage V sporulation protein aa [Paenibacillus polymyxa SQR-21]AIY07519.1 stage V sporulation protein AA [Paenibacillus polymyxa]AUS27267.1 stage V sporulation protein AA [Paenibacillus polymyxa]KAE8559425.1 stage V sporulation protein AA [Paenibacillus polymyxa]KAF6620227.1 stage V sporulation protein AA [Paenibacillus sp. EKM101P]